MEERIKGRCKWWSLERGYGFLTADGQDYFVHYSEIKDEQKSLFEGDEYEFESKKTEKGYSAINVIKV